MSGGILGLLLAGGRSERMGRDKALLVYDGEPQIVRAHRLLSSVCESVLVSVRREQAGEAPYERFELAVDEAADAGPAAGLLAAWRRAPGAALLVLAVDLPCVDEATLRSLLESRDRAASATAFQHPDGTLEPLCTLWEPAALEILRARAQNRSVSLRRVLEGTAVRRLTPPDPRSIVSVNSPADYAALRDARQL